MTMDCQAFLDKLEAFTRGTLSETERKLDHSWFVGLAEREGAETPEYAVAVIVEYGGSGGRVAGPVANQIIRALQEEGYLPLGEP